MDERVKDLRDRMLLLQAELEALSREIDKHLLPPQKDADPHGAESTPKSR